MMTVPPPSRVHFGDLLRTASLGLRIRRVRALLSALGILIGVASMVAVVGLSESSRSDLIAKLDRLGTNLLQVQAGQGIGIGQGRLPETAQSMIGRIGPVQAASAISTVGEAGVYRNDLIPPGQTGGITVQAVDLDLLETLGGVMAAGRWLDEATASFPTVVLGSVAAQRLGVGAGSVDSLVWIGDEWWTVIGVLEQFDLSPDLDRAALVGMAAAADFLDHENVPSTIYVRTHPEQVDAVRNVMAATANPAQPDEVVVTRPTDALEARDAADQSLTALLLGLGSIALLVGGVGVANTMVTSVLERRGEIGLRRALGATRGHIRAQFLGEALLVSFLGGLGGVALGWLVTAAYARFKGWEVLVPAWALLGGLAAALVIGALGGISPAMRAARLAPTDALRSQ
ncbi:MAG TPA: ABC transporter permease [Acidimicrobiia bacterium]